MSDFGKFGMVRLVVEWASGFFDFYWIPIRGPEASF